MDITIADLKKKVAATEELLTLRASEIQRLSSCKHSHTQALLFLE